MEDEGDHVREGKYEKTWSPCRNEKIQDLRAELCDLALAARCEKNLLRRLRKKKISISIMFERSHVRP